MTVVTLLSSARGSTSCASFQMLLVGTAATAGSLPYRANFLHLGIQELCEAMARPRIAGLGRRLLSRLCRSPRHHVKRKSQTMF